MSNKAALNYLFLAMGYRIFFALAGLSALILIALWASIYDGSLIIDNYFPPQLWHAHEMLMGYSTAVLAGFVFIIARRWTGVEILTQEKLLAVAVLWIYGRIVPFYSELIPDFIIALIDFSFLPVLTYFISMALLKSGKTEQLPYTLLLWLMVIGNTLVHAEILNLRPEGSAWVGLNILIGVMVVMILMMVGRFFPLFTERGLKGVIAIRNPFLDLLGWVSAAAVFGLIIFGVDGWLLALTAVTSFLINAFRALGWFDRRILYVPLLWVLYVGYAWIMAGFVMLAFSANAMISASVAMHAFTIGGIGVLTLGLMARVVLGYSGKALRASNIIALAFILINLAALSRVFLPALFAEWYGYIVTLSIYCWLAAFALFVVHYGALMHAFKGGDSDLSP